MSACGIDRWRRRTDRRHALSSINQCIDPIGCQLIRLFVSRAASRCLTTARASSSPTLAIRVFQTATSLFIARKSEASLSSSASVNGVLRTLAGLSQSGSLASRALLAIRTLGLLFLRLEVSAPKLCAASCLHNSHACAKLFTSAAIRSRHFTADVMGQVETETEVSPATSAFSNCGLHRGPEALVSENEN
jgi:hypothetical protein